MIIYNLFDALYKSFKSGDVFQVSDYDLSQCSDNNKKGDSIREFLKQIKI